MLIYIFFNRGGNNTDLQCENGYFGPLCSCCMPNFSKMTNSCIPCTTPSLNILALLSILFLFLTFLFFLIRHLILYMIFIIFIYSSISIKQCDNYMGKSSFLTKEKLNFTHNLKNVKTFHNHFKTKQKISVNLRIIFNFFQLIAIVQNIDFHWPFVLKNFFTFYVYICFTNQIFSLDCLFHDHSISENNSIYYKLCITEFFPFILIIFSGMILLLIYFKGNKSQISRFIVAVLIIFIFFQPSVISQLLELLSCRSINDGDYLSRYLIYKCYTEEHLKWVIKIKFSN